MKYCVIVVTLGLLTGCGAMTSNNSQNNRLKKNTTNTDFDITHHISGNQHKSSQHIECDLFGCSKNAIIEPSKDPASNIPESSVNANHAPITQTYAPNENKTNPLALINQQLIATPQNAKLYQSRALIYGKNKNFSAAENDYARALKIDPNNMQIQNEYARFLCKDKHDPYSANIVYHKLVTNAEIESKDKANLYTEYADCLSDDGNFDDALNWYNQALALDNSPFLAYQGIADLYIKQNNYAVAYYYASLYHGVTSVVSLSLQLNTLKKLLASRQPLSNRTQLQQKFTTLKQQYQVLTSQKYE